MKKMLLILCILQALFEKNSKKFMIFLNSKKMAAFLAILLIFTKYPFVN
ncbi:MAG: hypothetical protein IIX86_02150 [Clostridia bacterium]|nr:hypothetical protein [Clostridia bacterium]